MTVRDPLGTALIIPPLEGPTRPSHFIVCLFTSFDFGRRADNPDMIANCTHAALLDLKHQMDVYGLVPDDQEIGKLYPNGLYTCRFNSGLFGVPWSRTRNLLAAVALRMTVVYQSDDMN